MVGHGSPLLALVRCGTGCKCKCREDGLNNGRRHSEASVFTLRTQRLAAPGQASVQRIHDGVQNCVLEVRRVGELLLAVAGRLAHQDFVSQRVREGLRDILPGRHSSRRCGEPNRVLEARWRVSKWRKRLFGRDNLDIDIGKGCHQL